LSSPDVVALFFLPSSLFQRIPWASAS